MMIISKLSRISSLTSLKQLHRGVNYCSLQTPTLNTLQITRNCTIQHTNVQFSKLVSSFQNTLNHNLSSSLHGFKYRHLGGIRSYATTSLKKQNRVKEEEDEEDEENEDNQNEKEGSEKNAASHPTIGSIKDIKVIQKSSTTDKNNKGSTEFSNMKLSPSIMEAMKTMKFTTPTLIQELVIPHMLQRKGDLVFASQTGTGKTLAYMLPIQQLLKEDEQGEEEVKPKVSDSEKSDKSDRGYQRKKKEDIVNKPKALILLPFRDLANQVAKVAKELSHFTKLRVDVLTGGVSVSDQSKSLKSQQIDILVATPGRLFQHIENKTLSLSKVKYLVIDEADSMFATGKGFDDDMKKVLKPLMYKVKGSVTAKAPRGVDFMTFTVCSATLSAELFKKMTEFLTAPTKIVTPTLHHNISSLEQRFVEVVGGDKHKALTETLESLQEEHKKKGIKTTAMIFCNSVPSCRSTDHFLTEKGFRPTCMHGEMPPKMRSENWENFLSGDRNYLVCTDISSRGLDTIMVNVVINFDFPTNVIDYLHRAGRTARATKPGLVVSLVTKKDTALMEAIQEVHKRNISLELITASRAANKRLFHQLDKENNPTKKVTRGGRRKEFQTTNTPKAKNFLKGKSGVIQKTYGINKKSPIKIRKRKPTKKLNDAPSSTRSPKKKREMIGK
eukprot:TRINITY_DN2419_c0_g3_i1.p1 TRINITY_DN2419_c0_g3~~TRINITY_DN2419_c0_g3_i1.p1  ORF type:complete len:669 (-),score=131.60 TRINITY_DN2419_c0_g3_i1:40-2046(-)